MITATQPLLPNTEARWKRFSFGKILAFSFAFMVFVFSTRKGKVEGLKPPIVEARIGANGVVEENPEGYVKYPMHDSQGIGQRCGGDIKVLAADEAVINVKGAVTACAKLVLKDAECSEIFEIKLYDKEVPDDQSSTKKTSDCACVKAGKVCDWTETPDFHVYQALEQCKMPATTPDATRFTFSGTPEIERCFKQQCYKKQKKTTEWVPFMDRVNKAKFTGVECAGTTGGTPYPMGCAKDGTITFGGCVLYPTCFDCMMKWPTGVPKDADFRKFFQTYKSENGKKMHVKIGDDDDMEDVSMTGVIIDSRWVWDVQKIWFEERSSKNTRITKTCIKICAAQKAKFTKGAPIKRGATSQIFKEGSNDNYIYATRSATESATDQLTEILVLEWIKAKTKGTDAAKHFTQLVDIPNANVPAGEAPFQFELVLTPRGDFDLNDDKMDAIWSNTKGLFQKVIGPIFAAFEALQSLKIVHGDIKLLNLVWKGDDDHQNKGYPVLIDWDNAKLVGATWKRFQVIDGGTPNWFAPEMFAKGSFPWSFEGPDKVNQEATKNAAMTELNTVGIKLDMWSLGVLIENIVKKPGHIFYEHQDYKNNLAQYKTANKLLEPPSRDCAMFNADVDPKTAPAVDLMYCSACIAKKTAGDATEPVLQTANEAWNTKIEQENRDAVTAFTKSLLQYDYTARVSAKDAVLANKSFWDALGIDILGIRATFQDMRKEGHRKISGPDRESSF